MTALRRSPTPLPLGRRLIRLALYSSVLVISLLAIGILNNNYSLTRPSLADFQAQLDRSFVSATYWSYGQPPETNGYLTYMLQDCAQLSGDPRLQKAVAESMVPLRNTYMARLVEPDAPFIPPGNWIDVEDAAYHRWLTHAISRGQYPISPKDRALMLAPEGARTGRATHQLFTLILYRRYNGTTPALDQLIRHLSLRIAGEAALDFRVTDLYLQRISFLLAAGQPDLVQPRWVERALAAQDSSGGWFTNWYGWAPTPYRFALEDAPLSHPTSQGLWLTCMLKYRFPAWSRQHYR